MIEPHGGQLVDRVVEGKHTDRLKSSISSDLTVQLDSDTYQDLINIANGRFSPLSGFMNQKDFLKVVNDMTLEDGTIWPLPIVLDVDSKLASTLSPSDRIGLKNPSGNLIAALDVNDIYRYDSEQAAEALFGTSEKNHPGVERFYDREPFFIGGPVSMFEQKRYNGIDLLPKETRVLFEHNDWQTVVGFQTRNAPHRAHEYIQKSALEHVDGLFIQPKLGDKKVGDYRDRVIITAYRSLLENYYPDDQTALSVFPSKMNYAGPREAIFDAIVRKNQGCSHFIVGRDHAGVGDYYDGYASQRIFETIGNIGITPLFYNYSFFCKACDGMASEKVCPHREEEQIHPSGTRIREIIQSGSLPSEKMMRPEVAEEIMKSDQAFVAQTNTEHNP